MWYKNIAGRFFGVVTKHAGDGRTDGQMDGQNYESQDRASLAVSCGKNGDLQVTLKNCGTSETVLSVIFSSKFC